MKKLIVSLVCVFIIQVGWSQDIHHTKKIAPEKDYENILVKKLSDDQLQTSFMIWVKNSVKLHKHNHHTENIYVVKGKGEMTIGDQKFIIKKGDYFTIPKGTPHALKVLSHGPVQVVSIQSPKFVGTDRIFIKE